MILTDEQRSNVPNGWGNDELTKYLNDCRGNQFATFQQKQEYKRLERLDSCFRRIFNNALNVRPSFPMQFLLRSHSAFLCACAAAMAGQTVESSVLLRLSIESASYGFYANSTALRAKCWQDRAIDLISKKKFRNEFTAGNIKKYITEIAPKIAEIYEEIYDRTIDYGAHPNEQSFILNTFVSEDNDLTNIGQVYLQADGVQLDFAMKTTSQVGMLVLTLYQLIYPERWMLLGIKEELVELRRGL